ncbi:MAG TPA: mechanosensitive ion channel, partial [Sphingomicrobium sp.]|nr:mechanosensitive ion channel [Sphingomicrobium sp.]
MISDGSSAYLQNQLVEWGPRIGIALVIIIVTWLVARAAKWTLRRAVNRIPALRRPSAGQSSGNVADQLGAIVKLVIWLVGLMAALQFLGLGQILQPVSTLTNEIFAFLPRLIGAGLIFFIGLVVARIVRELFETLIKAADFSGLMARASSAVGDDGPDVEVTGPSGATKVSIARACGIVVFALIIIPVAIAAIQVLGIDAISRPAVNMLNQILAAIPEVLAAALWLGIAFLAAKLLKNVLEDALPATGFDEAVSSTGMLPPNTKPSLLVANVAFVLILLGAGIEASRQIGGNSIAAFLVEVTALGTRVIFGAAIIAAGVFLAR